MKVRLEGIKKREYADRATGLLKTAIDLQCVKLNAPGTVVEGLTGNEVLSIGADPKIPGLANLQVGKVYNLEVDTFVSKSGRFSKLVAIET